MLSQVPDIAIGSYTSNKQQHHIGNDLGMYSDWYWLRHCIATGAFSGPSVTFTTFAEPCNTWGKNESQGKKMVGLGE